MKMHEMHLRQPRFHMVLLEVLQKKRKEYKNLKKQKIRAIFIKTN